jgi:hypothetical protein
MHEHAERWKFNKHLHRLYSHFYKNYRNLEWNMTLFYVTKETDYSTTSINNDQGDKHSNMSGFVLKSLFCFSWAIVCCLVMYNCSPFKYSHRWRYCICQKISPQAFTAESQWCRSKHIPSAKNSIGCCLSLYSIAPVHYRPLWTYSFEGLLYWSRDLKITRQYVQAICRIFEHLPWHGIPFVLNSVRHMGSG